MALSALSASLRFAAACRPNLRSAGERPSYQLPAHFFSFEASCKDFAKIRAGPPEAMSLDFVGPSPPQMPTRPPGPWLLTMSTKGFSSSRPCGAAFGATHDDP